MKLPGDSGTQSRRMERSPGPAPPIQRIELPAGAPIAVIVDPGPGVVQGTPPMAVIVDAAGGGHTATPGGGLTAVIVEGAPPAGAPIAVIVDRPPR
ncbi:hypothetical protein RB195_006683 [Necator americanus]|uniref:Uncharacterized protein n=1 Tax=Necator americanus TaxID=51031 RepID=A0ABR1BTT2_NECAM